MDYRADHAEHKFPGAPWVSFDCHSSSLAFCSSTGRKWAERVLHVRHLHSSSKSLRISRTTNPSSTMNTQWLVSCGSMTREFFTS